MLVFLIICVRISWFSMIFWITWTNGASYNDSIKQDIFILDVTGTYLELLLGIQQGESMYELYLMIKSSVMQIEATQSEKSSFLTEKSGLPFFSIT